MVLLLSIDGLMPSQVLRADVLGLKVPNLRRLTVDGAFASGVRGVVPAVTYPSHTTLLTGTSPAHHGVLMNTPFDPLGLNKNGWSWYAKDIRNPTLWSAATSAGLVTANLCWPVSVSAPVTYNVVQYWRGSPDEDRKLYDALSTPGLLDELQAALGPLPYGLDFGVEADETRARWAEQLIRTKRPSFITAYLGSLDETEHRSGTSAEPALAVLERLDAVVGRLRAALEAVAEARFVLAVVSDHGFADYSKEMKLGALLAERGLMQLGPGPKVTAWSAAPWIAGGTAAIVLRDQNDLAAKQSLARLVEELEADPKYGVSRVFRGAELDALGGFSGADTVIALKEGFKFGSQLKGPVITNRKGGTHGYLPDEPGMDAVFFVVGQGVPAAHSLGRIDMRDIAPTLAAMLGISLSAAEGKVLWPQPSR
jgi:predicted AlkP superfamily pyrophosphatase or phosphodiesterase